MCLSAFLLSSVFKLVVKIILPTQISAIFRFTTDAAGNFIFLTLVVIKTFSCSLVKALLAGFSNPGDLRRVGRTSRADGVCSPSPQAQAVGFSEQRCSWLGLGNGEAFLAAACEKCY